MSGGLNPLEWILKKGLIKLCKETFHSHIDHTEKNENVVDFGIQRDKEKDQ